MCFLSILFLFKPTLSRVLKSEEKRLWDIVRGIKKQTLLSQAIQIIDRMDTEGNSEFITIEHRQENRDYNSLASVQIHWGGTTGSNNASWQHDLISDHSRYSNRSLEEQSSSDDFQSVVSMASTVSQLDSVNVNKKEVSSVQQNTPLNLDEIKIQSESNAEATPATITTNPPFTDSTYSEVETIPAKSNVDQAPTHIDNVSMAGLSLVSEATTSDDSFHSF